MGSSVIPCIGRTLILHKIYLEKSAAYTRANTVLILIRLEEQRLKLISQGMNKIAPKTQTEIEKNTYENK